MGAEGRQKKSESSSDLWRRIEQSGLDNALRKLSTSKSDLIVISSVSSDDSISINGVMEELCEMLNCIRLAYINNETEIFDKDEREKRFLTTTCPSILEVWSAYSTFAADYAITFVQKGWLNSSEHKALLRSVLEVVACSVKLLVLTVNVADYHNLSETDALCMSALSETEFVSKELEQFFVKASELGEKHSALEPLLEIAGWLLHGLNHVCNKVIKVGIEAREPNDDFNDHVKVMNNIEDLLKQLQTKWRIETVQEEASAPPPVQQQEKKGSKEVKVEQAQVTESSKQQQCLDTIKKISDVYKKYSEEAWQAKRLPVISGRAGVTLKYRMECYDQLGKLKIDACEMSQRKPLLDSMKLTDDHTLHSDIFAIGPDGLSCTEKVTIEFPLNPSVTDSDTKVLLKLKTDGQWSEQENPETISVDGEILIRFNTSKCEAFTAVSYKSPHTLVVGPAGANYVSEDNGKVEVSIPQGCFENDVTIAIKTHEFDKQGYDSMFVGVVYASVAIDMTSDITDVKMNKPISIQLPIKDDQEDKDTELVVVRCNESTVQVLDKKQVSVKCLDRGLFTIDVKGLWCIAVLRIKRIFLNMRESIKKEFMIGYGRKLACNIVTFIDDVTRGDETQTFIMEVIEKREVEESVESKKQLGLFEVKKGRSKDVLIKRGEQIAMIVDGQMRSTEATSEEQNVLCFIRGGANVISTATEIKRDPEKLPDAMIFYKQHPGDTVVHSMAIMTRDLSELPTENIVARTGMNVNMDSKKNLEKEESAMHILNMESLMSLARELTFEEGTSLGHQLGVKPETIKQIKEGNERNHVAANFQILCKWRGRFCRSAMADFLVSSLKAVGKMNYADLVSDVRKSNRGLERTDFENCRKLRRSKTSL